MAAPTPFVINMVPAGFKWSAEAAGKAAQKGAFLRVGGLTVTRRSLSGARRSWQSDDPNVNQTIFNVQYRITGTPQNVALALQYAGFDNNQIQRILNDSITKDNYQTTMAAAYNTEIQNREGLKGDKPAAEGFNWDQILWFAQNLKGAVIQTKTGEQRGAVASPGRAGAGDSLAEKIKKLPAGKVLDVSGMDVNTGKGVRAVPAPKTTKAPASRAARRISIFSGEGSFLVTLPPGTIDMPCGSICRVRRCRAGWIFTEESATSCVGKTTSLARSNARVRVSSGRT